MNMKIFVISPFESRMSRRATRHPMLAQFLAEKGHNVVYLTSNFAHAQKKHFTKEFIKTIKAQQRYVLKTISIIGYGKNISFSRVITHCQFALKVFLFLLRKAGKDDCIIIPSRPSELIWAVALIKQFKGVRIIMDVRDIWPDAFPIKKGIRATLFASYCNFWQQKAIKKYDACVYTCPSFSDWIERYAPRIEKKFIPLGYDANRWMGCIRKNKPLSAPIHIAYVGHFSGTRNLFPMVDAVGNNERFYFTIIGEGDLMPNLREYVDKKRYHNIDFKGYLESDDVVSELQKVHIGVVAFCGEHVMPNKVFDYIAAYVPLFVFGHNSTSDFVKRYNIGWVVDFDAQAAENELAAISEEDIINKSEAIAKMREQFSKECLYKEYVEMILKNA